MPACVGGRPAGQPGQEEGRNLRMQELFGYKGHLKPLALEAGKVFHCCRVPGGGLLQGHWEKQRGEEAPSAQMLIFLPMHDATWLNLEDTMQSKRSQIQKATYCYDAA